MESHMGQTQLPEDRKCQSSMASSCGVFRHDPPLPCVPPFLLRVCWQDPDACCAPPATLPPLPVGGCLLVFCSLLICRPAAPDLVQNACVFSRQAFPYDDFLVDLSFAMPAQPVLLSRALQLPFEVLFFGELKSITGIFSGFPQQFLEVVNVPSACEAEELPKRTCARTALLLASPAASLSGGHGCSLDDACR